MNKFRVVGLVVLMIIIAAVCSELYVASQSDRLTHAAGAAVRSAAISPGTSDPSSPVTADNQLSPRTKGADNLTAPVGLSAPSVAAPGKSMTSSAAPPAPKEFSSPFPALPVTIGSPVQVKGELPARGRTFPYGRR